MLKLMLNVPPLMLLESNIFMPICFQFSRQIFFQLFWNHLFEMQLQPERIWFDFLHPFGVVLPVHNCSGCCSFPYAFHSATFDVRQQTFRILMVCYTYKIIMVHMGRHCCCHCLYTVICVLRAETCFLRDLFHHISNCVFPNNSIKPNIFIQRNVFQ